RMPRQDLLDYYDGTGINLKNYECRNAWNTLIVGRTGDAYPCWIIKVGNVREQTLKEIWNNAIMRKFRQTCQKKLFAMCPGCCFLDHKSGATAHHQASTGVAAAQG
ncbi:MAG TPA: SPASM domain-containing protein, partial [Candidatus Hydrogenedentes bacterium]|nr:SPASM domain-containing protein [Candidatus Hydrogenedentota bacterium]